MLQRPNVCPFQDYIALREGRAVSVGALCGTPPLRWKTRGAFESGEGPGLCCFGDAVFTG